MSGDFSTGGQVHPDGTVSFGKGDDGLFVQFFAYSYHMAFQSEAEGRPIHEKRDYIRIIQPGERDKIERQVREEDRFRFPRQWAAYQSAQEQIPDGTPMATLYPGAPHEVDMMRGLQIHTVEQLAALSEAGIARLGLGGRDKVLRAKNFIEAANKMRGASKLQAENDKLREEMATLRSQVDQLMAAAAASKKEAA